MLTTVDAGGRATAIGGDPAHPITAGFLCGKVSNYLDRVYAGVDPGNDKSLRALAKVPGVRRIDDELYELRADVTGS